MATKKGLSIISKFRNLPDTYLRKITINHLRVDALNLIGLKASTHDPIFGSIFLNGIVSAHRNDDPRQ